MYKTTTKFFLHKENALVDYLVKQKDDTKNEGVITVEYVRAGATADGAKDTGAGEFKVSEVGGFDESGSGNSRYQLEGPISCGGFRV